MITEAVIIDFLILSLQLYKLFSVQKVDNSSKVNAHNPIYEEKILTTFIGIDRNNVSLIFIKEIKKKKLQKVKKNSVKMSLTWWKLTSYVRKIPVTVNLKDLLPLKNK